jgi:hypothetical protein
MAKIFCETRYCSRGKGVKKKTKGESGNFGETKKADTSQQKKGGYKLTTLFFV